MMKARMPGKPIFMKLTPKTELTEADVQQGLKAGIGDGMASEAMTVLTGGAFLVALALLLGANNFQIGFLAALPTLTNVFQLISIGLVQRYNNRRAISVICSTLARIPLIIIGLLLLVFPGDISIGTLIFILCFFYLFGSISGPSWNSWMKDLIPEKILGHYFARRSRLMQTLNIVLSISLALLLDYIEDHYPDHQLTAYACMFALGGLVGVTGAYILSRVPEPRGQPLHENLFRLLRHPLKDPNFRRLMAFNSAWVFAVNLATPFFTVFLLKSLGIPLIYVVALGIISQLGSVLTLRLWGTFSDRYSNKTIIAICAPLYLGCFIAWCFVGIYTHLWVNLSLLFLIYLFMGVATAGINLSLTNIGLKLAPRAESIVYLSTKNVMTAFFSSVAPLVGGYMADFFMHRYLQIRLEWTGPRLSKAFRILELHEWNFLFLIAALMAFVALELLVQVKESGEVNKEDVRRILRKSVRGSLKEYFFLGQVMGWPEQFWLLIRKYLPFRQERFDPERKKEFP